MKTKLGLFSLLAKLGKDKRASGPRLLARLLRDEEGSYLIYVVAVLPILIGVGGLAGEGGLLFYNHRTLQSAADSAAYSAAIAYSFTTSADITTEARAVVHSYGFTINTDATDVTNQARVVPTVLTNYAGSGLTAIKVAVSRPETTIFARTAGLSVLPNSVQAVAIINGGAGGAGGNNGTCILALATTGTDISLSGTPTIDAVGCGVFSNSSSDPSISLSGHSKMIAGSVGAAGSVSVGGSSTLGPPPAGYTTGDGGQSDPYAIKPAIPTPGTCLASNTGVIKNTTATLNPGTYCGGKNGGIQVTVHGNVTLNPGTYIFDGSPLIVDSQSTITGKGVTLVFTDSSGQPYDYPKKQGVTTAMDISSGATVDLEAPALTATLGIPGMLIMANSDMPTSVNFNLWANSATSTGISGVIHIPDGTFNWGGGPILAGGCTQFIAYQMTLQGNATFQNTGCTFPSGGGGGGGGGIKPIGSVVTLVE